MTPARRPPAAPPSGVVGACVALVIGIALVRLVVGGWEAMSADHARYVFAGLSLIDGRGYVNEAGEAWLIRSPAYPLLVGGGFGVGGEAGAHLVAWGLGVAALVLAIAIAGRLGGPVGAVVTTAALISVPSFWEQIVSLGIDMPQTALFLAAVLLLTGDPTVRTWLLGGAVLGVSLLVKETLAPAVVLLPLAWLPAWTALAWPTWARLSAVFGAGAAIAAGWWWLLVLRETGLIFPLNALQAITPDEVPLTVAPSPVALGAVALAALAWAYAALARGRDPAVRVLVATALATVPAAIATLLLAQPARNVTTLAILTCIAAGVAVADVVERRVPNRRAGVGRAVAAMLAIGLAAVAVVGQARVAAAAQDRLPAAAADVVRRELGPAAQVVSTFRNRSALGVELFDAGVPIVLLPVRAVDEPSDPGDFLWLGVRRGTLFGLARDRWNAVVGAPETAWLVITAPHPLSPVELLPALSSRRGRLAGLTSVAHLDGTGSTVDIFSVRPELVARTRRIRLHAAPDALLAWLDRVDAGGATRARRLLVAERPVVPASAPGAARLADRLGDAVCVRRDREGGEPILSIEPAEGQADCVDPSELRR